MIPIAIVDLSPYKHTVYGTYANGCLRMLSSFDHFVALCIGIFIAEMNDPQSSDRMTEDYLTRGPITDDQYQMAQASISCVVNLVDSLLFMILVAVDTRMYDIKYDYNATTMMLTLYVDNK